MVRRLPAEDDPNLDRVRQVREREYLFIDTLDEYFEDFSARMYPTYQDWRQATYSEAIAYREQREKAKRRAIAGAVGIAAGAAAQMSDTTLTRYGGAVSIIGGAAAVGREASRPSPTPRSTAKSSRSLALRPRRKSPPIPSNSKTVP